MEVLNSTLYNALKRTFGEVRVVAQGIAITWRVVTEATGEGNRRREKRKVEVQGEEYQVNCPFCSDTRYRLTINHRWSVPDPELDTKNLWLMRCYNEECQNEPQNQERLFNMVYPLAGPAQLKKIVVAQGRVVAVRPTVMAPPGPLIRLAQLAVRHPDHPALNYLRNRYLDPLKIAKLYGVSYCRDSVYSLACDRIVFPVIMADQLVGWQARFIGESICGRSLKECKIPKFFSCPGQAKRAIAFNYDKATRHPTVAIVEGPTDVCNFGVQAMGILGKSMHEMFQRDFCRRVLKWWGEDSVVLVILDPKQDEKEQAKGRPHHLNVLTAALRKLHPRVVPVWLPEEYDPGSIDRAWAHQLCREAAAKEGLHISFSKPPRIPDDCQCQIPSGPERLHHPSQD